MISGLAPGYCAFTDMVGGIRSGYWATGSSRMDNIPASTMNRESTMESTGRRRKNPGLGATGICLPCPAGMSL